MTRWVPRLLPALAAFLACFSAAARAEIPSGSLRDQIRILSGKLDALEKRVASAETPKIASGADTAVRLQLLEDRLAARENLSAPMAPPFLGKNKFSGYADVSYVYNFNEPDNLLSALRSFDASANAFHLQSVWLQMEQDADPIGYVAAIQYGLNARLANGVENAADSVPPVLEVATVEWKPKLASKDFAFDMFFGKFQSMMGWEGLESPENWNFSPGYLDLINAPNTLVGTRAQLGYRDWLEFTFGVNNGNDLDSDNNQAKTIEGAFHWIPSKRFQVMVDTLYGAEHAQKSGDHQGILDVQAEIIPADKLTIRFDYQYFGAQATPVPDEYAVARGYAAYVRYQWLEWWAPIARLEFFDDPSGALSGTRQNLWEITVTNEFKFYGNVMARLEYRHDGSDKNIFGKSGAFVDTQDTIALEAIYLF